jgi:ADP-ribose pyrophosphatase
MTRAMTRDDVDVLDCETSYAGYFRIDRYRLRHRLYDGGWSRPMTREVFERGHAVAVILYDPETDHLIVIEQFRIGVYAALKEQGFPEQMSPWLLEVVAGIIDDGESPEDVARRECTEEAGCEAMDMFPVCQVMLSPGASTESVRIYCARVHAPTTHEIQGLEEEHEDIRVLSVPSEEVFRWLEAGRFVNGTSMLALQWFRANREHVRARWLKEGAAVTGPAAGPGETEGPAA